MILLLALAAVNATVYFDEQFDKCKFIFIVLFDFKVSFESIL